MTSLEKCQANSRALSDKVLPYLRRHEYSRSITHLIEHFVVSTSMMIGALAILRDSDEVQVSVIRGIKNYSAKSEGVRAPARLTLNMTSIYRLPQALIEQSKRCEAAREIDSRF